MHDASPPSDTGAKPDADASQDGGTTDADAGPGYASMPLVSRGLPAFASYEQSPAAGAVDADYATSWRSGHVPSVADPDWIALDISSIPANQRASLYSIWFNEAGYNYETSDASSYTLMGDFAIESNAGPGGGQPPAAGWTPLATKTQNTLSSGAHVLATGGANWLRIVCTKGAPNAAAQNTDTSLQWELYDAHAGVDAWKFGGDSITANSMGHKATNDSVNQLVNKAAPDFPAFEMAGHGGWTTATLLGVIDAYLANFPGRFYGLALGTNDAGGSPATYSANMSQLIDKVLAAGKVPVLPTIPYTGEPGHVSTILLLNAEVQKLYTTYGAKLLRGPDLYQVLYDGRATMFTNPTDLHPNELGNAAIRQAWADAMVKLVY